MHLFKSLITAGLAQAVVATPLQRAGNLASRATACDGNTATTRSTWCDYSLSTDYWTESPDTGVTREYYFELVQTTINPDGVERIAYSVNGSIPGPTIFADWGDTVKIHVTNSLSEAKNGTSIHFHGIRQNYTNQNDGVVSITQCPTAPGSSMTYTWKATQYGSTWYHSHIGLQAWEGVFGGIIINGPASSNYDEDKGVIFLNDWSHRTVDELYHQAESSGPPTMDNGLINGTNVFGSDGDSSQTGSRFQTAFTAGKSYRLRIVNAAIDTLFKFSIDNHTLTVIAADLVPIQPYTTTMVNLAIGQRYDIIVTADQSDVAENFWMRAIPQVACSDNDSADNIKGIVYYGSTAGTPTTTGFDYTDSCEDEDSSNLVPYVSKTILAQTAGGTEDVTLGFSSDNFFRWLVNGSTMDVEWENPTVLQIYNNQSTFETSANVLSVDDANEWVYLIVQSALPIPHPVHLHGHDFAILAHGSGTWDSSVTLNRDNPPRRDTALLPASGYLVLAFETDNPGAWLVHCHIGWHTNEGFAMQIVERIDEIMPITDTDDMQSMCSSWSTYATANNVVAEDSGV